MPSYTAEKTTERTPIRPRGLFGPLSAIDRVCISHLVGHSLARIEREFILQTLRCNQGNRTRAAGILGISIRSLRDRIRGYRERGENVPEPGSSVSAWPAEWKAPDLSH